jgi:hypothetical protein
MCDGARPTGSLSRLLVPNTLLGDVPSTLRGAALVVTFLAVLATLSGCDSRVQDGDSGIPTVRTGILIARDVSHRWALASGTDLFPLEGDHAELTKYERQRVTIRGTVDGVKKMNVHSIEPNRLEDRELRAAIEQLRLHPWAGPRNITSPTTWIFGFTDPMLQILQAGPAAQKVMLQTLRDGMLEGDEFGGSDRDREFKDRKFEDQIIILLGGVGDERAVEPIIRAMSTGGCSNAGARQTNRMANLALTNITQSEVIWGHGGGIPSNSCPDNSKACWLAWWAQNKTSFRVSSEIGTRNYSNYPNYGIYQQP